MVKILGNITAAFLLSLFSFCLQAQGNGRGGGIYAEDGAKITGTVIYSNQGNDGYGVAGGDVVLVNCTVVDNQEIVRTPSTQFPGFIYCANGDIVDTVAYESRPEQDAMGVVFWLNPDPYALWPRGYVLALKEEKKTLSGIENVLPGLRFGVPMNDTNSYSKTVLMAQAGSEGAIYCLDYAALPDQSDQGKWSAPAGRHLSMLLNAYEKVLETLNFLDRVSGSSGEVMQMQEGPYGSITQCDAFPDFWSLNNLLVLPLGTNAYSAAFIAEPFSSTVEYWFRPVFVY